MRLQLTAAVAHWLISSGGGAVWVRALRSLVAVGNGYNNTSDRYFGRDQPLDGYAGPRPTLGK